MIVSGIERPPLVLLLMFREQGDEELRPAAHPHADQIVGFRVLLAAVNVSGSATVNVQIDPPSPSANRRIIATAPRAGNPPECCNRPARRRPAASSGIA